MSEDAEELDILAAEYVLGSMAGAQRTEFEQRIERDARAKAAVAKWADRLAPLSGALSYPPVPDALWRRIESQIRPGARAPRPQRASQGWRTFIGPRNRTLVWGGLGALAAALVVMVLVFSPRTAMIQPPAQLLAHAQFLGEAGAPRYRVQVAADGASIYAAPDGPAPPPDRVHELWVLEPGGTPHSLGLLRPDRPVLLDTPEGVAPFLAAGAIVAISLEPAGGSPLDRPSGPVLIATTLAAA
jgi:anti-sigma-K factor RskA